MLPDGFYWAPRCHLNKAPNAIFYRSSPVAWIEPRNGEGWMIRLEVQKPFEHPLVLRTGTTLESSRAGCEMWVSRHAERLRREVEEADARLPYHQHQGRNAST